MPDAQREKHPDWAAREDLIINRNLHPEAAGLNPEVLERQIQEGKIKAPIGHKPGLPGQEDDHLQPMLHTSFEDVAGLQQKMQALSTENPAQERGLSLVEQIFNVLVKILNAIPGSDKMTEIPNPAIKKD
jgi:hypothetical protein